MSLCQDCVKGVRHEGTPSGKFEKIAGVDCYIATPTGDYAQDKVLLYLPDALGLHINAHLLVDDFANNGFKTISLDYYNGDPISDTILTSFRDIDIPAWLARHGEDVTRPIVDNVIDALKEQGVKKFAATGYCFGGRYVFDLAFDHVIEVGIVSHPSLLKNPEDLEKYAAVAKAPLLINSCPVDGQFPPEAQAKADEILGNGKFAPGYTREYFEGCTHGFAVRGDLNDPKVKAGKEGAFKAAVEWLKSHF
ncbi:hypothetical protein AX14_004748 [Amanita brunnescens Koide BX004]|nr:hypothetical protein AX14_004748 [Amanita brunnescens Koide BX004]